MRTIAIIPARGGSVGVPRKNLRKIGGRSLLARAVGICWKSEAVDAVYVTTENADIGLEAAKYGAEIIWRPAHLATSEARGDGVLLHALERLDADAVAWVQCTAPFMTPEEIAGTVQTLIDTGADVAVAAAATDAMLIEQRPDGLAAGVGFNLADPVTRRQDRAQAYAICGSVWALWVDRFKTRRRVYSDSVAIYPADCRFEIDSRRDLYLARKAARAFF